jgi:hypothetical protein
MIDKEDNLIITEDYCIRKINFQSQQIQTIAGDGQIQTRYDKIPHSIFARNSSYSSFSTNRDGIGLDSSFELLDQLVMDSKGFIYVVDFNTIRRISPQFEIKTIATLGGTLFIIPFLFEHFDS